MRYGRGEPARPGGGLVEGQNAELGGVSSVGSCAWGSRRLGRWRPGELQKLGGLGVSPAHEAPRSPEGGGSVQDEGPGLGTEQRPPRPLGPAGDSAIQTALDGQGTTHSQPAGGRGRVTGARQREGWQEASRGHGPWFRGGLGWGLSSTALRLRAPQRVSAPPASMSTPVKWVQFLPQGLFR